MTEPQQQAAEHLSSAAAKVALSVAPTAYGLVTLNQVALVIGIFTSLAVFVHTALKIWWGWQDRKAGRGAN